MGSVSYDCYAYDASDYNYIMASFEETSRIFNLVMGEARACEGSEAKNKLRELRRLTRRLSKLASLLAAVSGLSNARKACPSPPAR